jgi:hypothetical protein
MKSSGIKALFDSLVEKSVSSSDTTSKIFELIQTVASESKKIVENVLIMNERINQHEKIILELCKIVSENPEKKQNFSSLNISSFKSSKDTKPN